MRPSGDSASAEAESLKSVIWVYSDDDVHRTLRCAKVPTGKSDHR
jgi:hypothetical protein